MSQRNNILGILLGTAAGVGIGMLFAPDKGSVTRKRLVNNANAAKDSILTEAEKLKANLAQGTDNLRNTVADTLASKKASLDDQLEAIVSDTSYKAEDVITNLEQRLKVLKEKNKRFQNNAKSELNSEVSTK